MHATTHQIGRTAPHQLKSLPPVSPLQQSGSDGQCTCRCTFEISRQRWTREEIEGEHEQDYIHAQMCYSCTHPAPPCRAVAGSVLCQSPLQLGAPHQAAQQHGMHRKEACSHDSGLGLLHRSQQRKCGVLEETILCCKYLHT